jgi:hypothetical protein
LISDGNDGGVINEEPIKSKFRFIFTKLCQVIITLPQMMMMMMMVIMMMMMMMMVMVMISDDDDFIIYDGDNECCNLIKIELKAMHHLDVPLANDFVLVDEYYNILWGPNYKALSIEASSTLVINLHSSNK